MNYDYQESVVDDSETYYGLTIDKEEESNKLSSKVEEELYMDNQVEAKPENLRKGNIVKVSFGSNYSSNYNKTLYRVVGFETSKKCVNNWRRIYGIFLSPFSERAKEVMVMGVKEANL